jgi:hypothetical protein
MTNYSKKTAITIAAKDNLSNHKLPVRFKTLTIFAFLLLTSQLSYGQFSIEFGGTYVFSGTKKTNFREENVGGLSSKGDTSYYSYKYSASAIGIYAYPKVQIFQVGGLGFSIGAPINVGLSGSANSRGDDYGDEGGGLSFLIDLNLAVDVNGGKYNKKNENSPLFGYYAGVGYGLTNTNGLGYELVNDGSVNSSSPDLVTINGDYDYAPDKLSGKTKGLLIHAGIGDFSDIKFLNHLGLRVSYRPGSGNKLSYTMVSILLHF